MATELDLKATNYLRELVELDVETVSKLPVEKDRRRVKANQIRRAVKRHTEVSGRQVAGRQGSARKGSTRQNVGNAAPAATASRRSGPKKRG